MPKGSKYVTGTTPAHSKIHTNIYYQAVWNKIEKINDPDKLREALQEIKDDIIAGTFPYN